VKRRQDAGPPTPPRRDADGYGSPVVPVRPLRQFYADERTLALSGLPPAAAPFRRHRERFLGALATLSADEWAATTRCDAWSARDVCNHLVTADGFWVLTLEGRSAPEPTTFLRGFDPTRSPDQVIASRRDHEPGAVLEALTASTAALVEALSAIGEDEWSLRSESPLGHVPLRAIAAHSLWDSWLHERDVLLPLGRPPAVDEEELLTAAAFTLYIGGTQGGVLDDPAPVGDGPAGPVDGAVRFADLPGHVLRLCVDRDVRVLVEGPATEVPEVGSAVTFVEAITGRIPAAPILERLPVELAAQLDRARHIL
jgi:uncharacterized protein (TIGR03083 family)